MNRLILPIYAESSITHFSQDFKGMDKKDIQKIFSSLTIFKQLAGLGTFGQFQFDFLGWTV